MHSFTVETNRERKKKSSIKIFSDDERITNNCKQRFNQSGPIRGPILIHGATLYRAFVSEDKVRLRHKENRN